MAKKNTSFVRSKRTTNPTHPKVRVKGEKGSEQNQLRYELYREALKRIKQAKDSGAYFEAVCLYDALLADRVEAYTQHLQHFDEEHQPVDTLNHAVQAMDAARNDKGIAKDAEYTELTKALRKYADRRNECVHNFVIVKNANAHRTVEARLNYAKKTVKMGEDLFNRLKTWTLTNIKIEAEE